MQANTNTAVPARLPGEPAPFMADHLLGEKSNPAAARRRRKNLRTREAPTNRSKENRSPKKSIQPEPEPHARKVSKLEHSNGKHLSVDTELPGCRTAPLPKYLFSQTRTGLRSFNPGLLVPIRDSGGASIPLLVRSRSFADGSEPNDEE